MNLRQSSISGTLYRDWLQGTRRSWNGYGFTGWIHQACEHNMYSPEDVSTGARIQWIPLNEFQCQSVFYFDFDFVFVSFQLIVRRKIPFRNEENNGMNSTQELTCRNQLEICNEKSKWIIWRKTKDPNESHSLSVYSVTHIYTHGQLRMCRVPVCVDTRVLARISIQRLTYWSLGNVKTMLKILHPDSIRPSKCREVYKSWPTLKTRRVLMQPEIVVPAGGRERKRESKRKHIC